VQLIINYWLSGEVMSFTNMQNYLLLIYLILQHTILCWNTLFF